MTWDDRVEKFRVPAHRYRLWWNVYKPSKLTLLTKREPLPLELTPVSNGNPFPTKPKPHGWKKAHRQGVIVLPPRPVKPLWPSWPSNPRLALPDSRTDLGSHAPVVRADDPDVSTVEVGLLGGVPRPQSYPNLDLPQCRYPR